MTMIPDRGNASPRGLNGWALAEDLHKAKAKAKAYSDAPSRGIRGWWVRRKTHATPRTLEHHPSSLLDPSPVLLQLPLHRLELLQPRHLEPFLLLPLESASDQHCVITPSSYRIKPDHVPRHCPTRVVRRFDSIRLAPPLTWHRALPPSLPSAYGPFSALVLASHAFPPSVLSSPSSVPASAGLPPRYHCPLSALWAATSISTWTLIGPRPNRTVPVPARTQAVLSSSFVLGQAGAAQVPRSARSSRATRAYRGRPQPAGRWT
jgi:hypothetical protein